jgi:hypothetical protein
MPGCPCRHGAPIGGHHPKCPLYAARKKKTITVAVARRIWDKMQEDGDALDLDSFYEILKEVLDA